MERIWERREWKGTEGKGEEGREGKGESESKPGAEPDGRVTERLPGLV